MAGTPGLRKEQHMADDIVVQGFPLAVARGAIAGWRTVNKFARNIEIDSGGTADIWDGGHVTAPGNESLIWVAPTQARTHTIASSDSGDTAGGVGARTVRIFGLKDWTSRQITEDVTMSTSSPPVTTNSFVIIHRMKVLTKGATSSNVGIITATATTDGTVTAQIRAGQGATQMAIYGISSVEKAYMSRLYGDVNKAGGAAGLMDVSLIVNPEPNSELTNFVIQHTFGLQTVGTSAQPIPFDPPKIIEGPAIMKVQGISGTNDMDVSAGFDLLIEDV